jgi:hypothetical protein
MRIAVRRGMMAGMKSGTVPLLAAALGAPLCACSSCGNTMGCQSRDPNAEHASAIDGSSSAASDEKRDEDASDDPRIAELRQRAFDLLGGRFEIYVELEDGWFVERIRPSKVPPPTFQELRCPDGMAKIPGRDDPPLTPFCMSKTLVTAAQYRACVEAGHCTEPEAADRDRTYDDPTRVNYPINYVDYEQAAMYCGWMEGLVPSEDEWLWAYGSARNLRFPWGGHIPQSLQLCRGDVGRLQPALCPVGTFEQDQTLQGVFDMAGGIRKEFVRVGNSALPRKLVRKPVPWPDTAAGPVVDEEGLAFYDIRGADGTGEGLSFEFVTFSVASSGFRCVTRSASN